MINQILEKYSLGGNWVDLIFIIFTIYFIVSNNGFVNEFLSALGFLTSLIVSYKFYAFFGEILILNFSFSKGIANVSGFFIAWILADIIFYLIISKLFSKIIEKIRYNPINISLGFITAIVQSGILFLFFINLVFSFPVNPVIKKDILLSKSGPSFIKLSQSIEINLKNIFGDVVLETLNFLTIKPESNQTVDLGIRLNDKEIPYDSESEAEMLDLINKERKEKGIKPLIFDEKLREIARIYAREMFTQGFFSHISQKDQSVPLTRAIRAGATFLIIGENLAYAPDVYIAHQGLMNSEGHRKNILLKDFEKIGIGVADGGFFGKIFVQEFTD